ncbi:MAG: hypothetical protein ACM31L_18910 [Actinomycetota bacterium]
MKKPMMIVAGLAVAVVAVVAIALGLLVSNLDGLVKAAIEKYGSQVAGVPVKVDAVKISLSDGKGSIKGLVVGNPKGFTTDSAFRLGEVALTIDTGSVTANPVVIKEILVSAPEVTYELAGTSSNIDAIQKNVAAASGGAKSEPAAKEPAKGEERKLVIDQLLIQGGKVNLAAATPLSTGKMTGALPDIRLTGIGRKSGGATGAEVAGQVMNALSKAALEGASKMGVGNLMDQGGKMLDKATGGAGDAVKGLLGR